MTQYRNETSVVDAAQWDGTDRTSTIEALLPDRRPLKIQPYGDSLRLFVPIGPLQWLTLCATDWLVRTPGGLTVMTDHWFSTEYPAKAEPAPSRDSALWQFVRARADQEVDGPARWVMYKILSRWAVLADEVVLQGGIHRETLLTEYENLIGPALAEQWNTHPDYRAATRHSRP